MELSRRASPTQSQGRSANLCAGVCLATPEIGYRMDVSLRQVGRNAVSILTTDVMTRATSFLLYALVARHLGGQEFGQLSLALTFFYSFQVFALGGLKTLIIREVAEDKARTSAYFVNGCVIASLFSLAAIAAQWGFVQLLHYTPATTRFILLLSFGLLPYTLAGVCEAIFQAWERMQYIAYVNVPVNLAKIGFVFHLLSRNRGLDMVVLILLYSLVVIALIELWILLERFPVLRGSFNLRFALTTSHRALTFLGIDSILAVLCSLNFLFLSKAATEIQVGLYNATTQVVTPLLLVYQVIAKSIFPAMCRNTGEGLHDLRQIAEHVIELLLIVALPAVAGLCFTGREVLLLLYRNPVFSDAFGALRIIAWIVILQVFTSVLGQVLVASHRETATLRIVAVDTLVALIIGWPLIHYYGLSGAAVALLLTQVVDCGQHYIRVSRFLPRLPLAKIAWKPILAASLMVAYLAASGKPGEILTAFYAALMYAVAFFLLSIWACGGCREFVNKYRPLLLG